MRVSEGRKGDDYTKGYSEKTTFIEFSKGSKVIKFGDDCLDAENEAIRLCKENNLTFVSPYNDYDIISGQGTIGVEILEQNREIDIVFITVGGGGLISGISSYIKSINPDIKVIGCSPINSSIMINSIKEGKIVNDGIPTEIMRSDILSDLFNISINVIKQGDYWLSLIHI